MSKIKQGSKILNWGEGHCPLSRAHARYGPKSAAEKISKNSSATETITQDFSLLVKMLFPENFIIFKTAAFLYILR